MKNSKNIIAGFTDENADKFDLFEKTLMASRFFETLDNKWTASKKEKDDYKIVIKPNISMLIRRDDDGIYTDPSLTVHLLRLLLKKGYTNLTVVESQNFYGEWFTNRAVIQIAARARYFEEDVLRTYQGERERDIIIKGERVDARVPLVDLTLEMVKYDFGGDVGEIDLGKTWIGADYRINLAKMKTHFYCHYTLAIKNIYGCLPLQDKIREYHCKDVLPQWTAMLIKKFPVDFSIIDGYTSADGMQGAKMKALSFKSHTFIAGKDILAVDHFTASLMGQVPEQSVMYQEMAKLTAPTPYQVVGNAAPFQGWANPGRLYVEVTDKAQKSEKIMEVLGYLLTGGYDRCFPMKKDERSIIRKIMTSPKYIGNFFTDFDNVKINMKKMNIKWLVRKYRKQIPTIAGSKYLTARLSYLTAADIDRMLPLLEAEYKEKALISGHYFMIGHDVVAFPARLFTTNIAVSEILNHAMENKIQMDIHKELKKLQTLDSRIFGNGMKYPFCFQS